HRADLPPDHTQHKGHHHGQVQRPGAQAQVVKVSDLVQGCRMDDIFQPLCDDLVGCRRVRALAAVALDSPCMADTALLGFFVAHTFSVVKRMRVSNEDGDISIYRRRYLTNTPKP